MKTLHKLAMIGISSAMVLGVHTQPEAALASSSSSNSCYETWFSAGRGVHMEVCERSSGSGYTILRNTTRQNRSVCWTVTYENGRQSEGCRIFFRADSEYSSSCRECYRGSREGGVRRVVFTKNEVID